MLVGCIGPGGGGGGATSLASRFERIGVNWPPAGPVVLSPCSSFGCGFQRVRRRAGCPQGSMAKKDMSFIKMVANDEDFHREVYEHGQENLLVSALPPCVRSSLMRVLMPGAHSRPQWSTSTPSVGGRA